MIPRLITIAATFTADLIETPINFWIDKLKLPAKVELASYNQVFQQLLDPASLMARNQAGINFLLVRLEDWLIDREQPEPISNLSQRFTLLARNVNDFTSALKDAAARFTTPIVVAICPPSTTLLESPAIKEFFTEMADQIAGAVAEIAACHLIDEDEINRRYPVMDYYDAQSDKLGHIPYTSRYFTALGTILTRKFYGLVSSSATPVYKVLALDCDNTLWKGICGEDGPLGVEIDVHRQALQQFALDLQQRGMLICLCSKNNPEDVFEVFDKNPAMVLRRDDIVAWRINWLAKSDNLHALAREMNLGLDSFIFIDDSGLECAEIRARAPQVLTLQLPDADCEIRGFLTNIWLFDHQDSTSEDRQRTILYKQQIERNQLLKDSLTLEQFLKDLNLVINISPLQPEQFERAAQLTKRTNQFNFTNIRRTESELHELIRREVLQGLTVEVTDRFGSYGLVGLMLFNLQLETLVVDTFLLSCRALGRGVEHQMLIKLAQIAAASNCATITISFVETAKNIPARDLFNYLVSNFASASDKEDIRDRDKHRTVLLPVNALLDLRYTPGTSAVSEAAVQLSDENLPVPAEIAVLPWQEIAQSLSTADQILQAMEADRYAVGRATEKTVKLPASTSIEKELAEMWKDLLAIEDVDINDDFFELGGHSLRLTQLLSRINDAFSVEITINDVFDWPTISAMATLITERRQQQTKLALPAIARGARDGNIPLTPNQLRTWLFAQTNPKRAISQYLCLSIHILGKPDITLLTKTINEILRRHEILRTIFPIINGQPAQKVMPQANLAIPHIDLSGFSTTALQEQLQLQITAEAQTKIDIMKDLPIRATLIQTQSDEFYLLLTFHHIAFDGWSRRVFFREFIAIYQSFYYGQVSPLAELPIQYADFALWQKEFLASSQLNSHLEYWQQQLQALKVPDLSALQVSSEYKKQGAFLERLNITPELLNRLHILSQTYKTTLYMTLLAVLKTLIGHYADQEDIIVAAVNANRNRTELEDMIGLFANTLPLRTNLDGNPTFPQILQRVRESTLQAFAHQDLPIEVLVNRLLAKNQQTILNQVIMFNLQTVVNSKVSLPGFHIEKVENLKHGVSLMPLAIHALETETGLLISVAFDGAIYESSKVTKLLADYERLLETIVANPDQSLLLLRGAISS